MCECGWGEVEEGELPCIENVSLVKECGENTFDSTTHTVREQRREAEVDER